MSRLFKRNCGRSSGKCLHLVKPTLMMLALRAVCAVLSRVFPSMHCTRTNQSLPLPSLKSADDTPCASVWFHGNDRP